MPTTTRVTTRFREHLEGLRRCIDKLPDSPLRESLDIRLALLAGDIGMGFPVTEELEIEPTPVEQVTAALEALRAEQGIVGLLDDTASATNHDRDHRVVA